MSTNYYFKCKCCGNKFHIAKCSCGWLPNFEAYPHDKSWHEGPHGYEPYEEERPRINSVKDIKDAYDTGRWNIVDEYDSELSWEEFDKKVIQWTGGKNITVEPSSHCSTTINPCYRTEKDPEGYEFSYYEFY